jgi:hypothetical protein
VNDEEVAECVGIPGSQSPFSFFFFFIQSNRQEADILPVSWDGSQKGLPRQMFSGDPMADRLWFKTKKSLLARLLLKSRR